jgi:hypothetical protein
MSKIENFSVEFITETIMGECESIISEVENVYHSVTDDDMLNVLHFNDIRYVAENLQSIVLDFAEEKDEYQTKCLLDEMSEESINLYQNIKYILEHCETEIFTTDDIEITSSFEFMRHSINTIRSLFV